MPYAGRWRRCVVRRSGRRSSRRAGYRCCRSGQRRRSLLHWLLREAYNRKGEKEGRSRLSACSASRPSPEGYFASRYTHVLAINCVLSLYAPEQLMKYPSLTWSIEPGLLLLLDPMLNLVSPLYIT